MCTQEKYVQRTLYLASEINLNIQGIQSDTMFYDSSYKNTIREFFASTKAIIQGKLNAPYNTSIDISQAALTHAEAATAIRNLLIESGLINE